MVRNALVVAVPRPDKPVQRVKELKPMAERPTTAARVRNATPAWNPDDMVDGCENESHELS